MRLSWRKASPIQTTPESDSRINSSAPAVCRNTYRPNIVMAGTTSLPLSPRKARAPSVPYQRRPQSLPGHTGRWRNFGRGRAIPAARGGNFGAGEKIALPAGKVLAKADKAH
jgi:hypothetical protein